MFAIEGLIGSGTTVANVETYLDGQNPLFNPAHGGTRVRTVSSVVNYTSAPNCATPATQRAPSATRSSSTMNSFTGDFVGPTRCRTNQLHCTFTSSNRIARAGVLARVRVRVRRPRAFGWQSPVWGGGRLIGHPVLQRSTEHVVPAGNFTGGFQESVDRVAELFDVDGVAVGPTTPRVEGTKPVLEQRDPLDAP